MRRNPRIKVFSVIDSDHIVRLLLALVFTGVIIFCVAFASSLVVFALGAEDFNGYLLAGSLSSLLTVVLEWIMIFSLDEKR
jgi:hypothetical protein